MSLGNREIFPTYTFLEMAIKEMGAGATTNWEPEDGMLRGPKILLLYAVMGSL